MNNCLILLTNYYPYYKGEEYLETEIKYLSKGYKYIYILSTMASKGMKQTRVLPDNVVVIPVGVDHSIQGKLKLCLHGFKSILKDTKKNKMIKENSGRNILHRLYSIYFEGRSMNIYSEVESLLDKIDFEEYTVITIYSYWLYVTARVAVELKNRYFKNRQIYTFSRAHGYDININASPIKFIPHRKFLLKNLDNVFPCSQNGEDYLKKTYPEYAHKIFVKRLGTEMFIEEFGSQLSSLHIVSCSTVRRLKRLPLIIDALKILEAKEIQLTWTHLGGGPEYKNVKKIAQNKLKKTKFNLVGRLSNKEVLEWYKNNKVTVFVNVSTSEGVPVSIMEISSIGIPVIATDVGGTKEIVEDTINGFIMSANCSPKQLAEKIQEVIELNEQQYQKLSRGAFKIWNERSNAKILYNSFVHEIVTVSKIKASNDNI